VTDTEATVLVVDDDPAMASAMCELLNESGYRPRSANSGPEALLIIKRDQPDLVISDLSPGDHNHRVRLD
jgi:two-component system response regulator BaeR